jgi:hypothetical protein
MFCPQCGQQQIAGVVRFCSRCGFPLDGVMQLLDNGGMVPAYRSPDEPAPISPKRRGVKQGGLLFLSGALIVPILGMFASYVHGTVFPEILAGLAAIICFIGGPLRMLYAALFEEGAPKPVGGYGLPASMHAQPQFVPRHQPPALQPPPARQQPSWRPRPITSELPAPPSVTENTTRLLDKDDRSEP